MKILNLYAGIGGNRALWGDGHEIAAVESKYASGRKIAIAKASEKDLAELHHLDIPLTRPNRKLLRNAVIPELGLHVFNCRDSLKQERLEV